MMNQHYSPLEYKLAFTVFKELKPDLYETIDNELKMYSENTTTLNPIYFLNSLYSRKEAMGETIFSMYYNIYESIFDKQYKLDLGD